MYEISGATIDTWPRDGNSVGATTATGDRIGVTTDTGNSIGATTATDETDTVPLDKVEAMIQNDIAENGDDGEFDAGGDG